MRNWRNLRIVSLLHVVIFLWATITTLTRFQGSCCCDAKEIEVTAEWTRVGENDTIPAGVHVRMDLTTGEKWVKLIDDNDDKKQQATTTSSSTTTAIAEVQQTTTSTQGTGINVVSTLETSNQDGNDDTKKSGDGYDYEVMYRTLSQLPDDEQERMGGLPELPGLSTPKRTIIDPADRKKFEERIKEIWTRRQEELKQLSEDLVADLPEILKDRIQRLYQYLQHPHEHLLQMNLEGYDDQSNDNGNDEDGKGMEHLQDIVSLLQDLEYHLSDLDMTRDFYTLGGWPLLVSLLSDSAHVSPVSPNTTTAAAAATTTLTSFSTDLQDKIYSIQAHAAWAIGTAVKNTEEFHSYAVEEVVIAGSGKTETPLALLSQLILAQQPANNNDAVITTFTESNNYFATRKTKAIYGLACLLRGNRLAQIHFCAGNGPQQLGHLLLQSSAAVVVTSQQQQQPLPGMTTKSSTDVAKRLLTLANDIVSDVVLHAGRSPQVDQAIISSFADDSWCQAVVQFLWPSTTTTTSSSSSSAIQETALQTFLTLAPYCNYDDAAAADQQPQEALKQLQQKWETEANEMDPDLLQERKQLLEAAWKVSMKIEMNMF